MKAAFKDDEEPERDLSEPLSTEMGGQVNAISQMLIGDLNPVNREYLFQSVPSKEFSDLMLWNFFNSSNPALCKATINLD